MSLAISETFTSVQGEGPRAGRVCHFIRTGGCNLACSWCDTPYTWDSTRYNLRHEFTNLTPQEIVARVPGDVDEVVITGGEPLIHQRNRDWGTMLRLLHATDKFICIETNGTIAPDATTETYVRHYSISPKLDNAGHHKTNQDPSMAHWPMKLRHNGTACLKFVVLDADDVKRAVELAELQGWPHASVWVMPEGTSIPQLLARWPEVASEAIAQRVNCCQRLHVLAFGDTRGT